MSSRRLAVRAVFGAIDTTTGNLGELICMKVLGILALVVAVHLPTTHMVEAAEVVAVSGSACAARLTGEIRRGDAAKALKVIADLHLNTDSAASEGIPPEKALCLNSPGGSYLEGRVIAQAVHNLGLTTRVEAEAVCYSACALIFMAGRIHGAENDGSSRYLSVKGRLGFHAPYFDLADDEKLDGKSAKELVTLSQKIVAEFIRFGSFTSEFNFRPMISMSLLAEMLASGPNEMSEVRTVEDVARWQIAIDGIPREQVIDPAGAVRACLNFSAWMRDEPSSPKTLESYLSGKGGYDIVRGQLHGSPAEFLKLDTGGMEERYCLVELPKQKASGTTICTLDGFSGQNLGNCAEGWGVYLPWYYSRDPATPIRSLAN